VFLCVFCADFLNLNFHKKPGQTASFCKFVGTPGQAMQNRDVPGKTGTSGHPSLACITSNYSPHTLPVASPPFVSIGYYNIIYYEANKLVLFIVC